MKTPLPLSYVVLTVLFFLFSNILNGQQRPGIECGCNKYGYYPRASTKGFSVYPGSSAEEGFSSKKKKYRLLAVNAPGPNEVNLSIYYQGSRIFNENTVATSWGFSPDEDRFVIHGMDAAGNHWCILANLNPESGMEGEPAIVKELIRISVRSAVIRFSPNGKYLLYAAIDNNGKLVLKVFDTRDATDVSNFTMVYDASGTSVIGNMKFLDSLKISKPSAAAWGFSPDTRNETFIHSYRTDVDKYTIAVKNLKSLPGQYVLHAQNVQGQSYWAFSPCGDYFAWFHESPNTSPVCRFYRTIDSQGPFYEIAGGRFKNFSAREDGHYVVYQYDSTNVFDNTAGDICSDSQPPTWAGNASLDAHDITGFSVRLTWNGASDNTEVTNYSILQNGAVVKEMDNSTQCEVKGLFPNTSYTFKVEAGDEAGNWSNNGPQIDVLTNTDNKPVWVNGEIITITDTTETKLTMTWKSAEDDYGIEYYHIYKNGTKILTVGGDENEYRIKGLEADTTYTFEVEAEDGATQISEDNPVIEIKMPAPEPPYWGLLDQLTCSDVTETTLILNWPHASDNFNEVKNYNIYKDDVGIGTTRWSVNQFPVRGLKQGESYHFKVIAVDESDSESDPLSAELSTLPSFTVQPLITHPAEQILPDICGNLVVWQDNRNGNWDIYMYNLETAEEIRITDNTADQIEPRISGERIVWTDNRNGNLDIYMYDPALGEIPICTQAGNQDQPSINGYYIVWRDDRNGNYDIYMFNLYNMTESPVCTRSSDQITPDFQSWGIAYADNRNGNWDIYMYDNYRRKERLVCSRSGDQKTPSVGWQMSWGLGIAYTDMNDIYVYYPTSETRIKDHEYKIPEEWDISFSVQRNPHFRDGQLVFEDNFGGDGEKWMIYAYDFAPNNPAGSFTRIPVCVDQFSNQTNPRTSKRNIVWEDDRNGNSDIYIWKRPPGSDLQLTIKDSRDPIGIGDTLKYTLSLTNNGPRRNTNLVTVCTLPFQAKYIRSAASQGSVLEQGLFITWEVDVLRSDSIITLEVVFQTTEPAKLLFEAEVSGDGFETNPMNNKVEEATTVKEIFPAYVDEGTFSAIVAEPGGKVHLSYVGNNTLKYASRLPKGKWDFIDLGQCFECGENAMVMDRENNIHIVASDFNWDQIPRSRLYHVILDKNGSFSKNVIAISDSGFSNLNIQISADNELYLVYQQTEYKAAGHGPLKYMKTSGMIWQKANVLNQNSYDHIGFALDKNNNMHLSYYNLMEGGIFYQRKTSGIDELADIIELIESGWYGGQMEGMTTSLDLDLLENPHVSYVGSVNRDYKEHLKYAWMDDGNWFNKKIDEGDFISAGSKMKLGQNDYPHFAYHHELSRQLRSASHINRTIVKRAIEQNVWIPEIDMDIDSMDNKHITYPMNEMIHYVTLPSPEYFTTSPDTLDFGFVPQDNSHTLTLYLTNPAEKMLSIDSIVCPDERFHFDKQSFILYPYNTDSVAVTFNQTDNQKSENYIRIFYNSTSGLFIDVPVKVRSNAPKITVNPDPVDFGRVPLYSEDTVKVTVKNEGLSDLSISNVDVFLSMGWMIIPTDFKLLDHDCTILAPGDSCHIRITFKPTKDAGMGGHYSNLYIYSNDPENPSMIIKLTGDTPRPFLHIDRHIDFGYREMNQTYSDTIILINSGYLDLTISSITLSGTNPDQFAFENICTVILPGDSCKIPVSFKPSIAGEFDATLTVYSNFSLKPAYPVSLKGTTLFRQLSISTDSLLFDETSIGEISELNMHLSNIMANPVQIDEIQLDGKDKIEFSFNSDCSKLSTGMSCELTLRFHPYIEGNKSAYLRILSNDTENPEQTIAIVGSGATGPPMQLAIEANPETGMDPLVVNFSSLITGGQPPYHYEWDFDDGFFSTESNPIHIFCCPGAYHVTVKVSDALIESGTSQIKIVVGSEDVPAAGISASLLSGSPPLPVEFSAVVVGGDEPVTYSWDFGDGNTSEDANPLHTFETEGEYTVWLTVTDNNGDQGYDQVLIRVEDKKFNLSGSITDHSGSSTVEKSVVQLYRDNYENISATLSLDQEHTYSFMDVKPGLYTIKVNPDTIMYPDKLPTYLGNVITMADASWITIDEDLTGKDIRVVTMPPDMGGEGVIAGQLVEESSEKKLQAYLKKAQTGGEPVPGCYVYLKDAFDHTLKAYNVTEQQGLFRFDKLLQGTYVFVADYKGKPMDASNTNLVIVSADDSLNIIAVAGTDLIELQIIPTGTGIIENPDFIVYPVPASDYIMVTISEGVFKSNLIRLRILDLSGRFNIMANDYELSGTPVTLDISSLVDGLYILEMSDDSKTYRVKIVKM